MRWPGNRHLAFFSLGFLLVLAILNLSPLDFYIYNQGHSPAEVAVKEDYLEEESEGGSGGGVPTASPSKREVLTLVELRDAAVEALRSCSACAPHRWPLSLSNTHKSKISQFVKKNSPHRNTWLEREDVSSSSDDVVPNILHVVRYGAAPMSFMVSFCNVAQNQT